MATEHPASSENIVGAGNTTMATWAGAIVRALHEAGCDPAAVLASVGIDQARTDDTAHRIPVHVMTALWRSAVASSGDPAFGLRVARQVNVTTFHALVMAAMASDNLPQAVDRLCQFASMVSDGLDMQCRANDQVMTITVGSKPGYPRFAAPSVEATIGALVLIGRQMVGTGVRPARVMFRHRACCSPAVYRDFFQCPVNFSARCDGISIALADLPRDALITRSPSLAQANATMCKQYIDQRSQGRLQAAVRARLFSRLEVSAPLLLPLVAEDLAMSERKLQRLLREEGWQFRQIIDEVRADYMLTLLSDGDVQLQQAADRLGFDSVSAFNRACQRWHGCAPGLLRASLRDGSFSSSGSL
ncbi:AraC family transcriptional regulator [Alcanivorax sp. 1008]|uniref:AraC family transcriptional regulator n=1 Tax=Alcanivorax sp. 1008 TaxID=2816853 RepID=UPI001DA040C8|nr:AraC family transcriptional regulator [Alcanivorax sp. 1008]MCC1495878.1 AraC family transcriptional regulator [Alcanivorax sp. 1008]